MFKSIMLIALLNFQTLQSVKVEVNTGLYLERLPSVDLYEASSPVLFRITLGQIKEVICDAGCSQAACSILRAALELPMTIQPQQHKSPDEILQDDGEKGNFVLVARNHVTKLFSSQNEQAILQEQARIGNLTIHEVQLKIPSQSYPCKSLEEWGRIWTYRQKRISVIRMCQLKKVSPDIITFVALNNTLAQYVPIWKKAGYRATFKELTSYYTAPIVECVLSDEMALIGVLVPLQRTSTPPLEIRRLIAPSFSWNSYTCSLGLPTTDLAVSPSTDNLTIMIPQCDPVKEDLCLLAEPSGDYMSRILCTRLTLLGAAVKDLAKACPVMCKESGREVQYVTHLTSNKFLINHVPDNLTIACPNQTIHINGSQHIGALEIQIPIGCNIYPINGGSLKVKWKGLNENDLQGGLKYQAVIPAVWSKIPTLNIPPYSEKNPIFSAPEDCLDYSWLHTYTKTPTLSYPYLTLILDLLLMAALVSMIFFWIHWNRSRQQQKKPELGDEPRSLVADQLLARSDCVQPPTSEGLTTAAPATNTNFSAIPRTIQVQKENVTQTFRLLPRPPRDLPVEPRVIPRTNIVETPTPSTSSSLTSQPDEQYVNTAPAPKSGDQYIPMSRLRLVTPASTPSAEGYLTPAFNTAFNNAEYEEIV